MVDVYSRPGWFDELVVVAAVLVEGTGALLFGRALLRYRGAGTGAVEAYQALAWNLGVWFAFIIGSEPSSPTAPRAPSASSSGSRC